MKNHFVGYAIAGIAAIGFGLVSASAHATTLRLGHNTNPNGPTGQYFEKFADLVEQKTEGELKVRIFPSSQLGTSREMLEQVVNGLLDMTKADTSMLENIEPDFKAVNYPYVWNSVESMSSVLSGEIGDQLLESTVDRGIRGLGFQLMTPRGYYAPTPINGPEDLVGKKLRVQQSSTMINMVESIGGIPTPTAWGDVYSALQQGMIDGCEGAGPSLYTQRHGEIAKYYYDDGHINMANTLVISEKVWQDLSEEFQHALKEAAMEIQEYSYTSGWEAEQEIQGKAVTEMGVTIVKPKPEHVKILKEKVAPMYDQLEAEYPEAFALMQRIKAAQE